MKNHSVHNTFNLAMTSSYGMKHWIPEQAMDTEAGAARSQLSSGPSHFLWLMPSFTHNHFVDALRKYHEVRVEFQIEITAS